MAKTIKGSKGPGYEYWGRKANGTGKWCTRPGKLSKKVLKRKIRRAKYEE